MKLQKKICLGLLAAMTMTATAFANPDVTEISEIIHVEAGNSYHSHSVGFSDGSSQGWTEGTSSGCSDGCIEQQENSKDTAIFHEEHHFFSNGDEHHVESVIHDGYSQSHSWGVSNGESYVSHEPVVGESHSTSTRCGKHAEGVCGLDEKVDVKSLPLCGRHAEGVCRPTAETQVLPVCPDKIEDQKEACKPTATTAIAVFEMNDPQVPLIDFTMNERTMIDSALDSTSLAHASEVLLEKWPGGVRKDVVMFQSAMHGNYCAMALIRDRYPMFYYSFATKSERGWVNEALSQYGGIEGVKEAYRNGLVFPADADNLFEVVARHH